MQGVLCLMTSLLFFSGVDICSKLIVSYGSPVFINIIRYILLILAIYLIMGKENRKAELKNRDRFDLILRGVFQGGTGLFYLFAVQTLPLNLTSSLYFTAPLFIVALSPLVLKETVSLKQWIAVSIGMVGMFIILRPTLEADLTGVLWILTAMVCYVFLQIYTRKLSFKVSPWHQILYGNIGALVLGLFALPLLDSVPSSLPFSFFITITAMVSLTIGGQIFLVKAFSKAPASSLAPFNYFQLLFVLTLSYIILGESIGNMTFVGAIIIICGGILASRK